MAGPPPTWLVEMVRRSWGLRALAYLREVVKLWRASPSAIDLPELARRFPDWQRSQRPGASALADERPWLTYGATELLDRLVTRSMRVFEYGAGGSTLYLARRVREGCSVEHDPVWAAQVRARLLAAGLKDWTVRLVEPERAASAPAGRSGPGTTDPGATDGGRSFQGYVSMIDGFPPDSFDLVLVDGRARVACVEHAIPKLKPAGYLVLDNAECPEYARVHAIFAAARWQKWDFVGPVPYAFNFSRTCAWRKPE